MKVFREAAAGETPAESRLEPDRNDGAAPEGRRRAVPRKHVQLNVSEGLHLERRRRKKQ